MPVVKIKYTGDIGEPTWVGNELLIPAGGTWTSNYPRYHPDGHKTDFASICSIAVAEERDWRYITAWYFWAWDGSRWKGTRWDDLTTEQKMLSASSFFSGWQGPYDQDVFPWEDGDPVITILVLERL